MFLQAFSSLLLQLEEMPQFLQRSVASLPADVLTRHPKNDKSPLIEHLWHVRDCDSDLYALRIRRVLHEDRPFLTPVDVAVWPEQRNYMARNGDIAIAQFLELRTDLVAELKATDHQALARVGNRADGTDINVLGLIEQMAEHDRDHRWRIAAILRDFGCQG
jgi:hypothetical protein